MKEAQGASHPAPQRAASFVGQAGRGRRVSAGLGCRSGRELGSLRLRFHVCGFRRRVEQVEGEVEGARHCPRHQLGLGPGAGCLPPGFGSALTLRLVPRGLLPPSQSGPRPCAGGHSEPGVAQH